MGWKTAWFGSEHPTYWEVMRTVLPFLAIALTVHGWRAPFVPAGPLAGLAGVFLAVVLGVVGTSLCLHSLSLRLWFSVATLFKRGQMLVFLFVTISGASWLILKAGGSLLTKTVGTPFTIEATMRTSGNSNRYGCDYVVRGSIMQRTFPRSYCIGAADYWRLPDQEVSAVLTGRETLLGQFIERIEIAKLGANSGK